MSMSIGLTGMRTNKEEMTVISQNVANSSTAGFKAGRPELASLYSGGQPGGVEVSQVSQDFQTDGTKEFTGRDLDMAISGNGFFIVRDEAGQQRYTRAGMFSQDNQNNIISSAGMKLQGYGVDANNELVNGVLTDLKIGASNVPAKASTTLDFMANFKSDAPNIPAVPAFDPADSNTYNFSYSSDLFDSKGQMHTLSQYMVKNADNDWTTHYYIDGNAVTSQNITFNPDGSLNTPAGPVNLAYAVPGADPLSVDLDLTGTTQYAGDFSVRKNETDGYQSGELSDIQVSEDGRVSAVYTNGRTQLQGKVIMADFANKNGLDNADSTTFMETFSSGEPVIGGSGEGTFGSLTVGAYEGSNVDMTTELVKLMNAQRNFQANSKSVSAFNESTQVIFREM